MAEANDNPRGLSETTPEEEDARRKNGSSSSKQVPRKRRPLKLKRNGRDIYVNNQTPFKRQLYKCEKLFDKGASELIIHGLGAVVFKAVNLALQLKENHHGILDLDIKTSTVTLVDKLETLNDDAENEIDIRQNSGIHIRVFRKVPFAALRSKQRQTDADSAK
ncbi:ribonuclease p protein subunit p20 [Lasius niger]|uniref:Ribonuclease P protein subunit p20 n=1 Tax=Lasius niger TaxID=67767 RepID=A0A0J7L206_LASNI|nr:ribonuclease p protein subunit p20 [Lasius niger]